MNHEVVILITIGLTGQIRADCQSIDASRSTAIEAYDLDQVWPLLCEGGYVVDLRPLQDCPDIIRWVWECPLCNGQLEGEEMLRLADLTSAGVYRHLARLLALDTPESGPFDRVSATHIARYWLSRGARVGCRVRGEIQWSDGSVERKEER